MSPDKVFHTKDLSAQIGAARLSFAKAEYMQQLLDITPGSVSNREMRRLNSSSVIDDFDGDIVAVSVSCRSGIRL